MPVLKDRHPTTTNSPRHLETASLFALLWLHPQQPFSLYIWIDMFLEITRVSCKRAPRYNLWKVFKGGESNATSQLNVYNVAFLTGLNYVLKERVTSEEELQTKNKPLNVSVYWHPSPLLLSHFTDKWCDRLKAMDRPSPPSLGPCN